MWLSIVGGIFLPLPLKRHSIYHSQHWTEERGVQRCWSFQVYNDRWWLGLLWGRTIYTPQRGLCCESESCWFWAWCNNSPRTTSISNLVGFWQLAFSLCLVTVKTPCLSGSMKVSLALHCHPRGIWESRGWAWCFRSLFPSPCWVLPRWSYSSSFCTHNS